MGHPVDWLVEEFIPSKSVAWHCWNESQGDVCVLYPLQEVLRLLLRSQRGIIIAVLIIIPSKKLLFYIFVMTPGMLRGVHANVQMCLMAVVGTRQRPIILHKAPFVWDNHKRGLVMWGKVHTCYWDFDRKQQALALYYTFNMILHVYMYLLLPFSTYFSNPCQVLIFPSIYLIRHNVTGSEDL